MKSKISFFGMNTIVLVLFLLFMAQSAHAQNPTIGTFTVNKAYVNDNLVPDPVAPVSDRDIERHSNCNLQRATIWVYWCAPRDRSKTEWVPIENS